MVNILLFIGSGHSLVEKLKKLSQFRVAVYDIPTVPDFLTEIDLIIISSNFCSSFDKTQAFVNSLRKEFKKPLIEFVIIQKADDHPYNLALCNRSFHIENKLVFWLNKTFMNQI